MGKKLETLGIALSIIAALVFLTWPAAPNLARKAWPPFKEIFLQHKIVIPEGTVPPKPGCCSHHGGVCGCNFGTGMQQCCDGKDSPSCRCPK